MTAWLQPADGAVPHERPEGTPDVPSAERRYEPATFATDRAGRTTYASPEWLDLSGQSYEEALAFGWVRVLHPDDREIVQATIVDAIRQECAFSVRYRVMSRDGCCIWVAAGAIPSFGPPGRTFLGFLGSLTPLAATSNVGLKAYGSLGNLLSPPAPPDSLPNSVLELAADHLLMAHSLIAQSGGKPALTALETALHELGRQLARQMRSDPDRTAFQ